MWVFINFVFGLAIGHVGAGYVLYADYPRWLKILAMTAYGVTFVLVTLRPLIDKG